MISAAGGTDDYGYRYLVLPSADILFLARKGINGAGAPCYKVERKGPSPKNNLFSKSLILYGKVELKNKERRAVPRTDLYAHRAALIISGDINSIRVLRFIDRRALFLSDGHFYTP
ncbi:MAG: hypothetical protein IJK02_02550 [Clostridia bacterium]|nr:hypothetical protein [Clostridia bacterium]